MMRAGGYSPSPPASPTPEPSSSAPAPSGSNEPSAAAGAGAGASRGFDFEGTGGGSSNPAAGGYSNPAAGGHPNPAGAAQGTPSQITADQATQIKSHFQQMFTGSQRDPQAIEDSVNDAYQGVSDRTLRDGRTLYDVDVENENQGTQLEVRSTYDRASDRLAVLGMQRDGSGVPFASDGMIAQVVANSDKFPHNGDTSPRLPSIVAQQEIDNQQSAVHVNQLYEKYNQNNQLQPDGSLVLDSKRTMEQASDLSDLLKQTANGQAVMRMVQDFNKLFNELNEVRSATITMPEAPVQGGPLNGLQRPNIDFDITKMW